MPYDLMLERLACIVLVVGVLNLLHYRFRKAG